MTSPHEMYQMLEGLISQMNIANMQMMSSLFFILSVAGRAVPPPMGRPLEIGRALGPPPVRGGVG